MFDSPLKSPPKKGPRKDLTLSMDCGRGKYNEAFPSLYFEKCKNLWDIMVRVKEEYSPLISS